MSDVVLVLGPVAFSDFEIPERVEFGGAQQLAVHKLPGGLRVIDALGRDDHEITWSGIFAGPDATERARLLDLLRSQGAALPLTWDVFFYTVVICSFQADYRKAWWIPYRLTCTIVRDEAGAPIALPVAPVDQAVSDVETAAGLADAAGVDFAALQRAMAIPGAATPASAAYSAAQSIAGQLQAQLDAGIAVAQSQLTAVATTTLPTGAGAAAAGVAVIAQATSAAAQLAALTATTAYLGRAVVDLANPEP